MQHVARNSVGRCWLMLYATCCVRLNGFSGNIGFSSVHFQYDEWVHVCPLSFPSLTRLIRMFALWTGLCYRFQLKWGLVPMLQKSLAARMTATPHPFVPWYPLLVGCWGMANLLQVSWLVVVSWYKLVWTSCKTSSSSLAAGRRWLGIGHVSPSPNLMVRSWIRTCSSPQWQPFICTGMRIWSRCSMFIRTLKSCMSLFNLSSAIREFPAL